VGYVGYIKEQLDLALLGNLARRHPEWSFVLVGPVRDRPEVKAAVQAYRSLANVYLLGPRATDQLPAYVQAMDVCTMPYLDDGYTAYIYPMKLHEYLATGRPVVATPIRSLRQLDGLVHLARGLDEWSAAIQAALSEPRGALTERRRAMASKYDWDALVRTIADLLESRLARKGTRPGRLQTSPPDRP
jgi:glycosyltransferase involved in cell wall biosynthesis